MTLCGLEPPSTLRWVGAPFAAAVNYKVNKHANRMCSTIILFAFSKAPRGTLDPRCPAHRDLNMFDLRVCLLALHYT